jgi:hypothetical protein
MYALKVERPKILSVGSKPNIGYVMDSSIKKERVLKVALDAMVALAN